MSASPGRRAKRAERRASRARCNCGETFSGDIRNAPPGTQRAARTAVEFLDSCSWPPPAPVLLFAEELPDGQVVVAVDALADALPQLRGRALAMVRRADEDRRRLREHVILYVVDAAEHRLCCVVAGDPAKRVNVRGERGQA